MLIGLQKAVINSEPQNAVKSRKKKNQVRNDGYKRVLTEFVTAHADRFNAWLDTEAILTRRG